MRTHTRSHARTRTRVHTHTRTRTHNAHAHDRIRLTGPFDYVSIHDYGCYPPFAVRPFCNGNSISLAPLHAAKEVADAVGKPLFVGEFGSPDCGKSGWDSNSDCMAYPTALLQYQVRSGIQLSNAWTWCTATFGWCMDPNFNPSSKDITKLLVATTKTIN